MLSANVSHFNYATEFDLFLSKVVKSVERRGSHEVNPSDRKRHTMDQLLIQVNHKRDEGSSAYKLSNVMVTTQERLFECFQFGKGPVAAAVSAGVRVFPEFFSQTKTKKKKQNVTKEDECREGKGTNRSRTSSRY